MYLNLNLSYSLRSALPYCMSFPNAPVLSVDGLCERAALNAFLDVWSVIA